jgi:hypothetical protein
LLSFRRNLYSIRQPTVLKRFLYKDLDLYVPDLPTFQKLVNLTYSESLSVRFGNFQKSYQIIAPDVIHIISGAPDEIFEMTYPKGNSVHPEGNWVHPKANSACPEGNSVHRKRNSVCPEENSANRKRNSVCRISFWVCRIVE